MDLWGNGLHCLSQYVFVPGAFDCVSVTPQGGYVLGFGAWSPVVLSVGVIIGLPLIAFAINRILLLVGEPTGRR